MLLHVPSLGGMAKQSADEQFSPRLQRNVPGRVYPKPMVAAAVNGSKAKQLMREVEDLYVGYVGVKGVSRDARKKAEDSFFVEEEFGDDVDTLMSDNSDHSELTPRGDGVYKRRQNGPRGYGQGKVRQQQQQGGDKSKPVKYKLQGGQRPLKVPMKAADGGGKAENIGALLAQAYPVASAAVAGGSIADTSRQQAPQLVSVGGVGVEAGGLILPTADRGGMRNRSLPTLQNK